MAAARKTSKKSKSRKTTKKAKKKPSKSKSVKAKARKAPAKAKARKTPSRASSPQPIKAMRLTFSYDGDDVKLISQQRTEMMVPPSDPLKGYRKHKGFWAELKTDQDKTLYRQVMHNPTRNDVEVFPETPGESISREPAPKRKGIFVVLVPDSEQGEEVTLFRSAPESQGPASGLFSLASKPATEIMRFKLKK